MNIFALILVTILMIMQFEKRALLVGNIKKICWAIIIAVFSLSFVLSVLQYYAWKNDHIMRFVFETDGGLYSFFHSAFFNHFASHLLAFALAGLFALLMLKLNQRSSERFFEKEEILIAFLAGFLTGFPGFIFFIVGIIIAYLTSHLISTFIRRDKETRVIPLYFFWFPAATFVIIISEIWLSGLLFWKLLSV